MIIKTAKTYKYLYLFEKNKRPMKLISQMSKKDIIKFNSHIKYQIRKYLNRYERKNK